MVHIKDSLLLIKKRGPCSDSSEFPLLLSGPLPYVRRHITVNKICAPLGFFWCFYLNIVSADLTNNNNVLNALLLFPFQSVIHWSNKGCGLYCPVCGMVHIKDPLLLIEKVGFLSCYLSDPLPYVRCHIVVYKCGECVVK